MAAPSLGVKKPSPATSSPISTAATQGSVPGSARSRPTESRRPCEGDAVFGWGGDHGSSEMRIGQRPACTRPSSGCGRGRGRCPGSGRPRWRAGRPVGGRPGSSAPTRWITRTTSDDQGDHYRAESDQPSPGSLTPGLGDARDGPLGVKWVAVGRARRTPGLGWVHCDAVRAPPTTPGRPSSDTWTAGPRGRDTNQGPESRGQL